MSRRLVLGVVGLMGLVLLAGCIKAKTVVTVEKDGSGTVEETVYMKGMDLPFPGMEKPSPDEEFAKTREQAALPRTRSRKKGPSTSSSWCPTTS